MTIVLALGCLCLASGCSTFAKRTPTPAAEISPREAAAIPAAPGERFYLLVFGSQSKPVRPKFTHTWATLVKVTDGQPEKIEEHTISWMPATLEIRPFSIHVEPGVNLDLRTTIEEMLKNGEQVAVWGPYEIGPGLAKRFQVQKAFVESGQVGYQMIDSIGEAGRRGNGCDCIHAITDADPLFDRNRYPLSYYGESASLHIVRQLQTRPIIICPCADHGWLLSRLGLDCYPIERRSYHGRSIPNTPENVERYLQRQGH